MKIPKGILHILFFLYLLFITTSMQAQNKPIDKILYNIYPELNEHRPDLPSPLTTTRDQEFVVAVTKDGQYAIISVTLSNDRSICQQLVVDGLDFPSLAQNGIHSDKELNQTKWITGRSISEITRLGRPNGLSHDGFMAEDENILSVIRADNRIVKKLRLTHPQLAKPLFHVLNMMEEDLSLNRWNMAKHRWENIQYFFYNDQKIFVEAEDTKGGQESIFDDDIEGGFYIKLWRDFDEDENRLLKEKYGHLPVTEFETLKRLLSVIHTGEIEPQYIMRYGFYEGHTFWRTDPISLSFIFGLRELAEIEKVFKGELYNQLSHHFTE